MDTPPKSSDKPEPEFDPSQPFRGVVVCCTSIPPERRTDIAQKTVELGGIHTYDLTPEVTHLLVGEYETPKYRHVARERPDITPMAAGWVEAVRNLWVADADISFSLLESRWRLRALETSGSGKGVSAAGGAIQPGAQERDRLLLCLTGFDDPDERQSIINIITANGGGYTGDLTRRVTHLLVARPEGKKFAAAKAWGVHAVAIEWLYETVERGMILDEKCYDPLLPEEERGKGAWVVRENKPSALGKRARDASSAVTAAQEQRRAKLRRTTSSKLSSQMGNIWGGITAKEEPSVEPTSEAVEEQRHLSAARSLSPGRTGSVANVVAAESFASKGEALVFLPCVFYIHGFSVPKTNILMNTVSSLGGGICSSLPELASTLHQPPPSHRFLIVPQESQLETHPRPADDVSIITEFYIEKCLHKKQFFDPNEHVIGRPFPLFPIDGFEKLAICTAGFANVDLNHLDKAIRQLGARFEERFTPEASVLVCSSLSSARKQKLDLALTWGVPVVGATWLWACISSGLKVPVGKFMFPELKQKPPVEREKEATAAKSQRGKKKAALKPLPEPLPPKSVAGPGVRGIDTTAFDPMPNLEKDREVPKEDSNATTHFETAPTHQAGGNRESGTRKDPSGSGRESVPLSVLSANSRTKPSASPQKQPDRNISGSQTEKITPRRTTSRMKRRVTSEVADSEVPDDEESRPAFPPPVNLDVVGSPKPQGRPKDAVKAGSTVAERLALSAKLAAMLESTNPAAAAILAGGAGEDVAVALPSARPHRHTTVPTARQRRRGIVGRAVSNVSAASTSSGSGPTDSSVAGEGSGSAIKAAPATGSFTAALRDDGSGRLVLASGDSADVQAGDDSVAPSSTPLEFADPEAKRHREKLLSKMMGAVAGRTRQAMGGGVAARVRAEGVEETGVVGAAAGTRSRVTVASVSGASAPGRRATTRRSGAGA